MPKLNSFAQAAWTVATVTAIVVAGQIGAHAGPLATTNSAFQGAVNTEDGLQSGHDGGFWRGSQTLVGLSGTFTATADFAVFAPGSGFGDFLTLEYGVGDPTSGTEWVYAFQTTSNGALFAGGDVTQLNAGYDPDEIVNGPVGSGPGQVPGEVAIAGGIATSSSLLQGSSSDWVWSASLTVGQFSNILYYTSSFAPKKDRVTLVSDFDQKTSGIQDFASPSAAIDQFIIPEPASLALAGSLVVFLAAYRRRRQ